MKENKYVTICPHCDEIMEYKVLDKKTPSHDRKVKELDPKETHTVDDATFLYICKECPLISFEFIDRKDLELVNKYLSYGF